jgi:hypothetical protein
VLASTFSAIYFQAFELFPALPESVFRQKLTKELAVLHNMRRLEASDNPADKRFAATMVTSFIKVYCDIEREQSKRIQEQQLITQTMAQHYFQTFTDLKEATLANHESDSKLQSCLSFLDGHSGRRLPPHGGLMTIYDYLFWSQGISLF